MRGYQCTQWMVTVPVADPMFSPLIGTTPLTFAPLFVMRVVNGREVFERVASLQDLATLPAAPLIYFEARGPDAEALYANAQVGDELVFPQTSGTLSYWLETDAPYTTGSFTVKRQWTRASGSAPRILTGNQLQLDEYTFTQDDVNRWVRLSGFATSSYNGLVQILSVLGNTATISKTTTSNEDGAGWSFPVVEVDSNAGSSLEPRYFPTRERELAWQLQRSGVALASSLAGGATLRSSEAELVRSTRMTTLQPSLTSATNLFAVVRNAVDNLQRAAEASDEEFTALLTSTYGA